MSIGTSTDNNSSFVAEAYARPMVTTVMAELTKSGPVIHRTVTKPAGAIRDPDATLIRHTLVPDE